MLWAGERRILRRAAWLALFLAAGQAPALRADFRESFKKGIEAFDRKEWSDMARWMRQAAAEQPQEGESVKVYGMRFEPYLPHFYLGLALFQAGDCEGALEQWQLSESQRAVQSTSRYKLLVQNRDTCRRRVAAKTPSPPPSGPDPAVAAQAAREAEAQEAARRKKEQEAAEATRLREAREAQAEAAKRKQQEQDAEATRVREAEARRKRQEQEAAADAADTARIAEADRQAEANREQAARQEVAKGIQRAAADARKIFDRAAASPHTNPDLLRRRKAVQDLLRKAAAAGDTAPLADLTRLRDSLSSSASGLETALLKAEGDSGPPAELRAAARAFLRADYQEIVRTLGKSSFQDRRATLASHLLLAAARYSLYLQGGEKDAELRRQAAENVRACRRLNAGFQPDSKAFSPRFSEFFRTAG